MKDSDPSNPIYLAIQTFVIVAVVAFFNDRSLIQAELSQFQKHVENIDNSYHNTNVRIHRLEQQNSIVITALGFLGNSELVSAMEENLACVLVRIENQTIISATPKANELFGYTDLSGIEIKKLIPANLHQKHDSHVERYKPMPSKLQMTDRQLTCTKKDGTEFKTVIWLIPRLDSRYVLCVFL